MEKKSKTPVSSKKMKKSGLVAPKMDTPTEKKGKDTGKRGAKKRKSSSEDQQEESAVEVLFSEMPENDQAQSTPRVKIDTPKKTIKTPKSEKKMFTPKIAIPIEKTGKDMGKKSAKKKKPSSDDLSEEAAVEVLVSQMLENDQAESTPKVKTGTPKKMIKTPKSEKKMFTPTIATPVEKTGKDTGKKSAKKKKLSSDDQLEESAVEVLVSQMPENDQAESTPSVKTDTPKKTIKTPKSGKEMVTPKIATPVEKTGKDMGKRSGKKRKPASEDQLEESAVEVLVSEIPENDQAELTPKVKTDTPKKMIKTPKSKSENEMVTPKLATPVEKTGKDTGKRSGKKRKPASEDQLEESAVEVLVSEMQENDQAESTHKVKTNTPKKMIKTPKSGKEMVTPKIATPVEKTGKGTGKKSAKKKKPSSEDQLEESAVEVLVSQMPENGQAEATPRVEKDTPKKTIKTPKSGKKMKKSNMEDVADDALPVEGKDAGGDDDDDSMIISFPNIATSTPKIKTLDTTEELEVTEIFEQQTKPGKGKRKKRKSVGKKTAEEVDQTSKSIEKENIQDPTPASGKKQNKQKMTTLTVEEGSEEIKKSAEQYSELSAVKAEKTVEKIEKEMKEVIKDEGKSRKRSAEESDDMPEDESNSKKQNLDKYQVYCGNIPKGTDKEMLYFFIGENNIFPEIRMVKMQTQRGRGKARKRHTRVHHAILTCKTLEDAEKVVSLNGISMPAPLGRGESRLAIHHIRQDETDACKLYLGNLSEDTDEDDLKVFFKDHNLRPYRIIVIRRKRQMISKGYGFVWFDTTSDADKALQLNGASVQDQEICIEHLKKTEKVDEEEE